MTEVWKLMLSKHSKRLEYKEVKWSSELEELFLLVGDWLEGDLVKEYFFALKDNADGDFD
jgi:hypothetical protein